MRFLLALQLIFVMYMLTFPYTVLAQTPKFENLDPSAQAEIRDEAARLGMSVDAFLEKYVSTEVPTDTTNIIIVSSLIGTTLLIGGGAYLFPKFFGKNKLSKKQLSQNDELRKASLDQIKSVLTRFYAKFKRFPTEDEFAAILNKSQTIKPDPRKGEPVKGVQNAYHDYYYDQRNPISLKINPSTYRLWTFFEDGEQYTLKPE